MKTVYDYTDLIKELESDLTQGKLTPTSKIQVLRKKINGYQAIIDYTYEEDGDNANFDPYLEGEITDEKAQEVEDSSNYKPLKGTIETISVEDILKEMKKSNKNYRQDKLNLVLCLRYNLVEEGRK